MKFFFSEYQSDYSKYHFPYQVYLLKEGPSTSSGRDDDIDKIYEMGFLPSRMRLNFFYLARSLRVDLSQFEPSSENRRILRKTEYLDMEVKDLSDFEYDYTIGKLAKDFYDKRFGKGVMSANRIKWLFTKGACTHVLIYTDKEKSNKTVGYCPIVKSDKLLHYAYPFYDTGYFERNAGMGMMLRAIIWAQKQKLQYCYLGTCYTEKSLYKIQFKGVEYFTGFGWSSDVEELKKLVRSEIKGHLLESIENKDEVFTTGGVLF